MARRLLPAGFLASLLLLGAAAGRAYPDQAEDLISRARAAVAAKDGATALRLFFEAIQTTEDYGVKYAVRAEVLALPPVPYAPLDEDEVKVVDRRIAEERQRDVESKAGGLEGRGHLHAARWLHVKLQDLKGLTEDEESAHAKAVERIERALCDEATAEERAESAEATKSMVDAQAVFDKAQKVAAEGRGRVALRILRAISFSSTPSQEMRDKARAAADALRKKMIEEMPPEQDREATEIWEDPYWKGLATSVSHRFIYLGPKAFVETITDADRIRMDVANVLVGDLVGIDHMRRGGRISIYYKERWDFPGGIGGGHRIDIGKPAMNKPIAGALHWHEMSHCTFDVAIAYPGFVEGIANFGATFLLDAMGGPAECDASIRSNRVQFRDDYLGRRLEYFRIQPYGPSCGFLLTPITPGDAEKRKAEWGLYRKFFRRVRALGIDDPRDAERIRYFVWIWGDTFGWDLLEKAGGARFPVGPADRERVQAEYRKWLQLTREAETGAEQGFSNTTLDPCKKVIEGYPGSELADRAKFALAKCHEDLEEPELRDALYRDLGVIAKWKLCGPFYSRYASPLHSVFLPERTIDLAAEYPNPVETARWKEAKPRKDGFVDLIEHGYAYPDDAACYALADLVVPAEVPDAAIFLGFDDTAALWVNGVLIEKWDAAHGWVRDHHTARFPLKAGRNRLLLKVVNRRGAWAFSARVVRANRTPIEGLAIADPTPVEDARAVAIPASEAKGHAVFLEDFEKTKAVSKSRFKPTVGEWGVDNKALHRVRPGNVLWRKFTIQPFSSKDPPSALVWLVDKDLTTLTDFAVEVTVRAPGGGLPRIGVTLHGEGKDDGLSGHTFVVQPGGEGLQIRLEEYDRLVYFATAEVAKADEHVLRFLRRGRTLSCVVDGKPLLEDVDLPALTPPGIGLMTWDQNTGITRLRVERLAAR